MSFNSSAFWHSARSATLTADVARDSHDDVTPGNGRFPHCWLVRSSRSGRGSATPGSCSVRSRMSLLCN